MKKKKNNALPVLALILALAAFGFSALALANRPEDQSHLIDDLYRQNRELREQIARLEERLDQFVTVSSLKDWTLEAAPWADSTGADVTFTAIPTEYQPGMGAALLVMLEGQQVASVPCVWDGEAFSCRVSLSAADGYSYFCLLSGPAGDQQLSLTGPGAEDAGYPVFLQSALSSYGNLLIHDWNGQSGSSLVLTDAYAQVQLPQIQAEALSITTQELVLRLNGQVAARVPIELSPSEVEGSFEALIQNLHLPMPELENGDTLELYLEVTLSDGRHLNAFGIGWYLENGKLSSSVG